jgi:hypothetical protein
MSIQPNSPWGRDDLMALAAVRYCLGRCSYIVSDCCDWLCASWPQIKLGTQQAIRRDVEAAFKRDDAARQAGQEHPALGMDMDRAQWERVRALWNAAP